MKKINILFVVVLAAVVLLSILAVRSPKNEEANRFDKLPAYTDSLTVEDVVGSWHLLRMNSKGEYVTESEIYSNTLLKFELKPYSIAEVVYRNGDTIKSIVGTWDLYDHSSIGNKMLSLAINSDLKITIHKSKNDVQIFCLKAKELRNELVFSSNEIYRKD